MFRPVSDGKTLYAYYTFSYVSTLPEAEGKRVGFEGVSMMSLRDGKIAEYREVANVGPGFVDMGFAPSVSPRSSQRKAPTSSSSPSGKRHLA